jgi:hypothetical protein
MEYQLGKSNPTTGSLPGNISGVATESLNGPERAMKYASSQYYLLQAEKQTIEIYNVI